MNKILFFTLFIFSFTLSAKAQDTLGVGPPPDQLDYYKEDDPNNVFIGPVTKEAGFPGGVKAFHEFINQNIDRRYIPTDSSGNPIKVKVYVKFIVNKDGSIRNPEIFKGKSNCKRCEPEVLKLFDKMPKWIPAENNGRAVNRLIAMPITF